MLKSNGISKEKAAGNRNIAVKLILKIIPDWVTPNMLSILRLVMMPLVIAAMALSYFKTALALFILASLLDALDGIIARARGQITELGMLLDPLADKLLIMTVIGMLLIHYPFRLLIIYVFIFDLFILLVSALKVSGFKAGAAPPIRPANIWGKSKMLTQVAGISLAMLWLIWPFAPLLYVSAAVIWLSLSFQIISAATYSA